MFHNASVAAWVKVNLPPYEGWKWFTDPSGYNMSAVDCSCHGWIHTTNRKVCFHEVGGLAEKTKHEWLISKMTEQKTLKGNTLKPIPARKCMKWDQWFKKWIISQSLKKMGFYGEYVPEGLMTVHLHCALQLVPNCTRKISPVTSEVFIKYQFTMLLNNVEMKDGPFLFTFLYIRRKWRHVVHMCVPNCILLY